MGNLQLGILFLRLGARTTRDHIRVLLLFNPVGHQWDGHAVTSIASLTREVHQFEFAQIGQVSIQRFVINVDTNLG